MGVIVHLVDPAAAHLKRRAEQLGRKVLNSGGGAANEVMDGFIVRAVGNANNVVVTVVGLPWAFSSPLPNLYSFDGTTRLVREVRYLHPWGRLALDRMTTEQALSLTIKPEQYRPFCAGVAAVAGAPFPSVSSGAWSTADPVTHPGVVLCPAVRSGASGGAWLLDTVIYRATAWRQTLVTAANANDVEFRVGASVTPGELAYVLLDAASMGFSPGTPSAPSLISSPCATELAPGDGIAAVRAAVRPTLAEATYFARYKVDFATSAVNVLWRADVAETTPLALYAAGGQVRALLSGDTQCLLASLDPEAGGAATLPLFNLADGMVSNPLAYVVNDQPWFFCPRRRTPDLAPSLRYWTALEDLDAVLVSPQGAVVPVVTPGYFVQRATNRVVRSGSSDDGTIAPVGGEIEGRVARYGTPAFPEFSVGYACVYAPGILAVVVVPDADFDQPLQRRYLALVNATTGALIQVSPDPIFTGDVWYGVSVSCYEQGTVDDTGGIATHGALLVSVWRPQVAALDPLPPAPETVGVWVTVDAGQSLALLYQPASYTALAPIARALYLGSPLLPAEIGRTRRQWLTGQ